MNITELLDLLQSASWPLWSDINDELLEAGYSWELVCSASGNEVYWLKDLSSYFE